MIDESELLINLSFFEIILSSLSALEKATYNRLIISNLMLSSLLS